jgi:putative protease
MCTKYADGIFKYYDGDEIYCQIIFQMCPKDLNMVPYIQDMINAGINSFKIEGRMRSIYYIATVILCYKRIFELIKNNKMNDEYTKYYLNVLNRCANRESTPQFFKELPGVSEQYYEEGNELSNQDFF